MKKLVKKEEMKNERNETKKRKHNGIREKLKKRTKNQHGDKNVGVEVDEK